MHIEVARAGAPPPATLHLPEQCARHSMRLIKWPSHSPSPPTTTSRRKKREMGACASKPEVLEAGGNAPEIREMVDDSGAAAGEKGESKSRQSLEILLKEVEVTEPAATDSTKRPEEEEEDDEVGNASETVKQSVEEAMEKATAVEKKDEANNGN